MPLNHLFPFTYFFSTHSIETFPPSAPHLLESRTDQSPSATQPLWITPLFSTQLISLKGMMWKKKYLFWAAGMSPGCWKAWWIKVKDFHAPGSVRSFAFHHHFHFISRAQHTCELWSGRGQCWDTFKTTVGSANGKRCSSVCKKVWTCNATY